MFESELQMHNFFGEFLNNKICNKKIDYDFEVVNLFGIPDYVIFEKTEKNLKYIISVELKLKAWKQGIIQAYRYKNFSNDVYVILDESYIKPALNKIEEFQRYNVGLASFNKNMELKVYFTPEPEKPHSSFYTSRLLEELIKKEKLSPVKKDLKLWMKKKSDILQKKIKSNGVS